MAQAWRELVRLWKRSWQSGETIPGYGSARDYWRAKDPATLVSPHCPPSLPAGWTKGNLHTVVLNWCAITPAEIALARRGTAAMRAELPTIHMSRKDVEFGQHLFTDDLHHDIDVLVPEVDPPHQRPLEIGILDYASAYYGPFVCQPTLPMDDGTKRMLGWDCVKWAFGSWLEQNGLPLDWPIYLHVENGTATVDPQEAKLWHTLSGGIINVCYTEMQGKYCLAWDEKRNGNFRGKACLESAWGLHHNYEAALPGYIGKDRDHAPARLHGERREALALLKWAATLPADQRAAMQLPILTYDEFVPLRLDTVAQINSRTDHQLEGFESVTKWRPTGMECDWRALAALEQLPVSARAFVEHKKFLETPAERRAKLRGRGRWSACPPSFLAMVYAHRAMPLTVSKGTLHLKRGTSHWWYMADNRTKMAQLGIEDGKEYLISYNPFSMDFVHLLSADGKAYLDTWQQRGHRRGDKDANARSMAHRIGLQREVEQKVERLLIASGETIDTELRRDHNRALGAPAEATRTQIILNSAPADSSAVDGAALQETGAAITGDGRSEMGDRRSAELLTSNSQLPTFSPEHAVTGDPSRAAAPLDNGGTPFDGQPNTLAAGAHETNRASSLQTEDQRLKTEDSGRRTQDYILNQRSHRSASATSPDAGAPLLPDSPAAGQNFSDAITRAGAAMQRRVASDKQAQINRDQFRSRLMARRQAELAEADQF